MKNYKPTLWSLCFLTAGYLSSCGTKSAPMTTQESGGEEIVLESIESRPLYAYIDSVKYIPLETTEESLISSIAALEIMDDRYYILNGTYTSILIFDKEGKFLHGIYTQGNGPKEYIRIGDMKLDKARRRIIVSDTFSKKLLVYDRDGNWQQTVPMKQCWAPVVPFREGYIQVNDGRETVLPADMQSWNLTRFDENGNFQTNLFPDRTPNALDFSTTQNIQATEDGRLLFMPLLSSTIYRIEADSIVPAYRFVNRLSGYRTLSDADLHEIEYKFGSKHSTWKEYETKSYLCSRGWFRDSPDVLFTVFGEEVYCYFVYYDKHDRRVRIFDGTFRPLFDLNHLTAEQALGAVFHTMPLCVEANRLYTEFDHVDKLLFQGADVEPKFKVLCDALGEEDNPLLVVYTMKFPD